MNNLVLRIMISNFSEIKIMRGKYVDNDLFEKITVIAKNSMPTMEKVKQIVKLLNSKNLRVRVEAKMSRLGSGSKYYITYVDFVLDN